MVLLFSDDPRLMPSVSIHFDRYPTVRHLHSKIDGPVIAVDIHDGILEVDILALLRSECVAEELYEFVFRAAVCGRRSVDLGHDGLLYTIICYPEV